MADDEAPPLKGLEKLVKIKSKLSSAEGVVLLPGDKIAVADRRAGDVKLFDADGKFNKKLVTGITPLGMTSNRSGLLIISHGRSKKAGIRLHSQSGALVTEWGQDRLWHPHGVGVNNRGQIIVTDISDHQHSVGMYTNEGRTLLQFGKKGSGPKDFNYPRYVCSDVYDRIIVSDTNNNCVKVFDREGTHLFHLGDSGAGKLSRPHGVVADSQGNILVCDSGNKRVAVYSPNGRYVQNMLTKDDGLAVPISLCFSSGGKLVVGNHSSVSGDFKKVRVYQIA